MHIKTFSEFLGSAKMRCLYSLSILLFWLTGCGISDDDIYYYISDQTRMLTEGGSTAPSNLSFTEQLYETGIMVSDTMAALTPWIMVVTIALGILVKTLIKKADKLRRNGMVLFFGVIPALTIVLGYGFSILLNWFH